MSLNMDDQVNQDHMVLVSQFYPSVCTQIVHEQGEKEKKTRRRRKKAKGGDGGGVGARKRKLTTEQVNFLEQNFGNEHKLESERKDQLALELGLDPRQVAVWFQNRRARFRSKKLEEEYSKLKSVHEKVVVEKCQLEVEVLKLKEQLYEAEKNIQRQSDRSDVISINSPNSTVSMTSIDQVFFGEFQTDRFRFDDVFYVRENNYANGMEWDNLYYM